MAIPETLLAVALGRGTTGFQRTQAEDVAKHFTAPRIAPHAYNYFAPNVLSVDAEKL